TSPDQQPSGRRATWLLLHVVAQHLSPGRVTQLRHRLALDLADPFPTQTERPSDLVEGARPSVVEPVPQPDYLLLAGLQRGEHVVDLVTNPPDGHRVRSDRCIGVFDEVTELALAIVADGLVDADQVAGVTGELSDPAGLHVQFLAQLLVGRVATE